MKQQLKETITYQPNDEVKVTVNNTPSYDEKTQKTFYRRVVTIRVDTGWDDNKLAFSGEEDMRAFLDDIVLEDPQQELPL